MLDDGETVICFDCFGRHEKIGIVNGAMNHLRETRKKRIGPAARDAMVGQVL